MEKEPKGPKVIDFVEKAKKKGKYIDPEEVKRKSGFLDYDKIVESNKISAEKIDSMREFEKIGVPYFRKVEGLFRELDKNHQYDQEALEHYRNQVTEFQDEELIFYYRNLLDDDEEGEGKKEFYKLVFEEVKKRFQTK